MKTETLQSLEFSEHIVNPLAQYHQKVRTAGPHVQKNIVQQQSISKYMSKIYVYEQLSFRGILILASSVPI